MSGKHILISLFNLDFDDVTIMTHAWNNQKLELQMQIYDTNKSYAYTVCMSRENLKVQKSPISRDFCI